MKSNFSPFGLWVVLASFIVLFACEDGTGGGSTDNGSGDSDETSGFSESDSDDEGGGATENAPEEEDLYVIPEDLGAPPSGTARVKNASLLERTIPKALDALDEVPDVVALEFTQPVLESTTLRIFQNKTGVEQEAPVWDAKMKRLEVPFAPLAETGVFDVLYKVVHDEGEETGYFVFYVENREYKGQRLDSVLDFRENSIKGPQYVDLEGFRLRIEGLVERPLELSYDEVLQKTPSIRAFPLNCVEGWSANVLWEGVPIMNLLNEAGIGADAVTVIFHSYDNYTTSVSLDYLEEHDLMLAYAMNEVPLPAMRGFPFQVAAEDKWGYKWGKWVYKIELSDEADYRGFWESYGYNQDGDHDGPIWDKRKRKNLLPYCGHFE